MCSQLATFLTGTNDHNYLPIITSDCNPPPTISQSPHITAALIKQFRIESDKHSYTSQSPSDGLNQSYLIPTYWVNLVQSIELFKMCYNLCREIKPRIPLKLSHVIPYVIWGWYKLWLRVHDVESWARTLLADERLREPEWDRMGERIDILS